MNQILPQLKRQVRKLPLVRSTFTWADGLAARRRVQDQYRQFIKLAAESGDLERFEIAWDDQWVYTNDAKPHTGYDRHYLYHLAWAARVVAQIKPAEHYDFSSLLYFAALVSAFVPVKQHEFRPARVELDRLNCAQADLTALPYADGSVPSASCMHVIEHLGLGRYGDAINPASDRRAFEELQRVIAPGGHLLIVVPVGRPTIRFNGCRIYSYQQVLGAMPRLTLKQFALIPDRAADGGLLIDPDPGMVATQTYGCGCFWMQRPA